MDGSLIDDKDKNPDGLDLIVTDSRIDLLENKVTLAVPEGNPKGIESFDQLAELLKSGDNSRRQRHRRDVRPGHLSRRRPEGREGRSRPGIPRLPPDR